jgi:PAS domain S-box-containing protein
MIKGYILKYFFIIGMSIVFGQANAQSNYADLSSWDGENARVIDKDWTFIPDEFVNDIHSAKQYYVIDVGLSWNKEMDSSYEMKAIGKGTYLKTIFLPRRNTYYEFDFGTVSSAYALYINDSLIKTVGNPYANANNPSEKYNTEIVKYYAQSLKMKIVVHVQNWRYSKGGIWSQVFISQNNYAKDKRSKRISLIFVLFGGLVIMSFYHGGLYILRKKETSSLFFFLWTLAASFRLLFSGRYYPVYDLIDVNWYWTIKIEYLTFYLAIPLFMQFVYEIFPKSVNKRFISVYNILGLLFASSVFYTNIDTMTQLVTVYQVYTVIGIAYMLFVSFKVVKQKEAGVYLFILGFIILTISVFHDILVSNQILQRNYWFPVGILTFVFLQAYLLASRFTSTFSRAEVLSMQLNYMNLHLEKIVDERTEKLKAANEMLQQKNNEVSRQSEQLELMNKELKKLSVAASETDNGIIITNKNGEIEWVNKGFEKMYGFSLDELHKAYGYNLKNAGRSENMSTLFNEVITNKKSVNYESEVEAKNGKIVKVQTTLTPILNDQGNIVYMVAIDTDISEIKRVQEELSKTISAKNKLFSIIAHDLRNPFNSLLGLTELIIEQYDSLKPEELLQFIKDLNNASKSTYALLLNLLDWSRSQRNKIELHPKNYNLNNLIEESLDSFSGMLDRKSISVVLEVPEHFSVYADKATIETVFRNLISNSIKFSPSGSIITIMAYQQRNKVGIEVRDQGVGIPEEHLNSIFSLEGQYTSRGTEQEKGTGLGLMLCKDFVEKNKGTISVISRVGEGSTFIVMLPAHEL